MEECIVYLTDGKEVLVRGQSIYWTWYESEKNVVFWLESDFENEDDLRIAEFCKACVMGIVRVSSKSEV